MEEISLATFNNSVGINTSPMKVEGMKDIDDDEDEDGKPKKKAAKGGKQSKKEEAIYYRISVKVHCSISWQPVPTRLSTALLRVCDSVLFSRQDNGMGMPHDDIPKMLGIGVPFVH